MLSSHSHWGMCYLDLRYSYSHALLVLTKWSKSKIQVMQEQKPIWSISQVALMGFSLNGEELNSVNLRNHWSINEVQFKDLLCYLCLCGTVLSSLSLTQEIVSSNTTNLLIFNFLWLNSVNSVKTFSQNPNSSEWRMLDLKSWCPMFNSHWGLG